MRGPELIFNKLLHKQYGVIVSFAYTVIHTKVIDKNRYTQGSVNLGFNRWKIKTWSL